MYENNCITKVKLHSPADLAGVQSGERLLAVNGNAFFDIIDLSFLFAEELLELSLADGEGKERTVIIHKEIDQELGLEFDTAVFDGVKECSNACVFCFVDQMAPQMRSSLYVKDDDYRLSFLYGNFITFTNFTPADEQRILKLHLSPLYVSVHATDEIIRQRLIRNKRAGEILSCIKRLAAGGIEFHTQVVLCPGINDGAVLQKTFHDLFAFNSSILSMAVVPVGLTKYSRADGLRAFTEEEAKILVDTVTAWQKACRAEIGRAFIYPSDEFYVQAKKPVPRAKDYDGFPQYENGVGIIRKFLDEWQEEKIPLPVKQPDTFVVCGLSAQQVLAPLLEEINRQTGSKHCLLPVENVFFGHTVTVTGLLTGQDIMRKIMSLPQMPVRVIIPGLALRAQEEDFLDGMHIKDLEKNIPCTVKVAQGAAGLKRLLSA